MSFLPRFVQLLTNLVVYYYIYTYFYLLITLILGKKSPRIAMFRAIPGLLFSDISAKYQCRTPNIFIIYERYWNALLTNANEFLAISS